MTERNSTFTFSTMGEVMNEWTDPQAKFGGVVAAGSLCMCGSVADAVLRSPRWGEWDVCQPCGDDQIAALHGAGIDRLNRPGLTGAEAVRCIQLDRMLTP